MAGSVLLCPECGSENLSPSVQVGLNSGVVQVGIHCLACGWNGFEFDLVRKPRITKLEGIESPGIVVTSLGTVQGGAVTEVSFPAFTPAPGDLIFVSDTHAPHPELGVTLFANGVEHPYRYIESVTAVSMSWFLFNLPPVSTVVEISFSPEGVDSFAAGLLCISGVRSVLEYIQFGSGNDNVLFNSGPSTTPHSSGDISIGILSSGNSGAQESVDPVLNEGYVLVTDVDSGSAGVVTNCRLIMAYKNLVNATPTTFSGTLAAPSNGFIARVNTFSPSPGST